MSKGTIAAIVGPTACGKTGISVLVAQKLDAEIVCADSVQVYERLDIGSAKPTAAEMRGVPHHLFGEVKLDEIGFSVAQYQKMAFAHIDEILSRGKLPVAVGGTGLYLHSLTYPMDFTQAQADPAFREERKNIEQAQPGSNYAELRRIDPPTADRLHPNDQTRIVRALEVYHQTGKTLSESSTAFKEQKPPYESVIIGLTMDRESLYRRIDARVDGMMANGLLDEVRGILLGGYDAKAPSLQGLGYKELIKHFHGELSLDEAVELIKRETRRYAKRQWTWFRRDPRIVWFDAGHYANGDKNALAEDIVSVIRERL